MSKLTRQAVIREILGQQSVHNQDELRRLLYRRGHRVTQATLSRDIHELALVKTNDGYQWPGQADKGHDAWLPSVERLIREFVYSVRPAQNQVVVRTSAGSAGPVAAAVDAEEWPEILGTIAGDDTILIITADSKHAHAVAERIRELLA